MIKMGSMVCTVCPNGCNVSYTYEDNVMLTCERAFCKLGEEFIRNEIANPMRILTTTLYVKNGAQPLVSVRTTQPIPKDMLRSAIKYLDSLEVPAPIAYEQVLVKNLLDTGADVIATKEVGSKG